MTEINDLSIEILSNIFEYLGIRDIISLRLVYKQYKCVADRQKVQDLVIIEKHNDPPEFKDTWFCGGKIEMSDVLRINILSGDDYYRFRFKLCQLDLLSNLKRLKINTSEFSHIHRLFYNLFRFPSLEQLDCEIIIEEPFNLMICHDNLRFLYINVWDYGYYLDLDTPSLECLQFPQVFHSSTIFINHKSCLKYLNSPLTLSLKNMSDFKNLICIRDCWACEFSGNLLKEMPLLTEIRFKFDHRSTHNFFRGPYDQFVESMSDLIRTKDRLNRSNLKIYCENVEQLSVDQFEEFARLNYKEIITRSLFFN